ncbi:hypothetical protein NPIL_404661 [Nephila pilipes]|uniref:Secreted protein n=1 Tax=Nephila pilipes TaxID=299642 RepID=A0A8X6UMV9_NEPPI|nr:hypothetical protein NPIL_404661 [Nephila pilipes]
MCFHIRPNFAFFFLLMFAKGNPRFSNSRYEPTSVCFRRDSSPAFERQILTASEIYSDRSPHSELKTKTTRRSSSIAICKCEAFSTPLVSSLHLLAAHYDPVL